MIIRSLPLWLLKNETSARATEEANIYAVS